MNVRFACSFWGQEATTPTVFLARVLMEGFEGVEINPPEDKIFADEFQSALASVRLVKPDFLFIAQQVLGPADESVDAYLMRMRLRLEYLASLKPDFINSHTGKDYFSFEDNCRAIAIADDIARQSGIPVFHETHRGRFTFHSASLLPYLQKYPNLKLTADFSHWCTVSETLLHDQREILKHVFPRVRHIHARIGFEHSPQVNDPFAPEWKNHVDTFIGWWKEILSGEEQKEMPFMTITPEFGPVPYMPTMPYSQKPLADQWQVNVQMKNTLSMKLKS